jgi:ABC-type nitrate/sulfonate/bicarbonate transport system permease component
MRNLRAERPGVITCATSVVVLALLVLAWQLTSSLGSIPAYNLPSPSTAFSSLFDNLGMIAGRCGSTLLAAIAGLAASLVAALVLALIVVQWPALTRAVTTYALIIRTLPIVGVAPLVTLIAGRGIATSILCIAIVTVFTLYVSAVEGLQSVPPPVQDLTELYRTSFWRRLRNTLLPSAFGGLLMGLRIAGPLAVLAAILAEWLSGRAGVGSLMTEAQSNRDVPLLWATTIAAAVLGLVSFALPGLVSSFAGRRGLSVEPELS